MYVMYCIILVQQDEHLSGYDNTICRSRDKTEVKILKAIIHKVTERYHRKHSIAPHMQPFYHISMINPLQCVMPYHMCGARQPYDM
jgi:hypothetical protein